MSRGSGILLYPCRGWPLISHQERDKGITIGGVGYIILGVHQEVKLAEGIPSLLPMAGQVYEWYCLERIRDGAKRDVPVDQVQRFMKVESLNAMEVLARVERGHGEASESEPGKA